MSSSPQPPDRTPTPPTDETERWPERRYTGPERRRNVLDARSAADPATGLERRRGPGRRRTDFARSAEEGEMTPEQFLFLKAIDAYKRANDRPFPTWSEVLEVLRKLGYRKTQPTTLAIPGAEDWTEAPDAPAFAPIAVEDAA